MISFGKKKFRYFQEIYSNIENPLLQAGQFAGGRLPKKLIIGCWNNRILEYGVGRNTTNIILTLGLPSAILCRQKKYY
jgi:hypothetical protein